MSDGIQVVCWICCFSVFAAAVVVVTGFLVPPLIYYSDKWSEYWNPPAK